MTKPYEVQINATDYDSGVVIEAKQYRIAGELSWAVPAWEEMGLGELEGPFPDIASANAALASAEPYLADYGYAAVKTEA